MNNKYYIEITPLDKEKDILERFAGYDYYDIQHLK